MERPPIDSDDRGRWLRSDAVPEPADPEWPDDVQARFVRTNDSVVCSIEARGEPGKYVQSGYHEPLDEME